MTHLSLSLLGSPEVEHNEQAVSFPTRKTLALLIYLAVEEGMQPREKLATLFWPESRYKSGRASLRNTLAMLRKELAHASQPEQPPHLNVARDAIGFNSEADYTLDLDTVQTAVANQQINRQSFDSAQNKPPISNLSTAVSLIRGEFLEGFSLPDAPQFDDWVTLQQQQWHVRCRQLFDRLGEQQMERGETAAAIVTLNRWLALSPLEERAYRRLMQAHTIAGNRPAALQLYEKCQSVLAAELGVEPSPETAALAERIRAADKVTAGQVGRAVSPATPYLMMPVIGRAEEHSQLVAAYHHVGHGRFQIVTVQGEAGIGKTSLAGQFLNWAGAQEATVLRGRAFQSGGRLPYQPIVDLLRPLWRDGQPDDPNNELSPTWLAELSRLLPELHDIYPDLPPPTADEATARTRLFEAVARLGQALSRRAPLVLFVDDIQWADAASLDLLQYVARRWHDAAISVMLLFGVRSEALARAESDPSEATLQEWLASLGREAPLTRLKLTPLTAGNTQQLVKALGISDEHEAQLARWLYAETGGQPFFLAESVKALIDDDVLAWRRAGGEQTQLYVTAGGIQLPAQFMPPGVRDVLLGRLARLSTEAFRLLAAGAVLGQAFGYRQLCRVAGLDADEGLAALDALLAANLLEEVEEGERPYLFAHDKIRDVVYTEAGDARRRLFHERAYELLAESESPPAQIAHHARSAGLAEPAFRYTVGAGDVAMDLFAVRDAVTQYEQARALLQEHPHLKQQIDPAQLHLLYGRLGRGYELLDAWDQAQAVEEEMLALAEDIDLVPMKVTALNRLATVAIQWRMDVARAAELLETAVALAEAYEDKAGLAEAEWNLAQTSFYRRDRPGAIRHGERALALAESLERPKLVARSHNILSYAKSGPASLPQLAQAKSHAAAAKALYATLGNRAMEIDCLNMLGSIAIHSGRPAAAEPLLRQAREASVEIGNEWGQANTAFNLAQALLELGQYGEALARAEESVAIAQSGEPTPMVAGTLSVRGGIWRALLALDAALEDHLAAKRLFADTPNPHITHLMAADLCADYALMGQWDDAHRCAWQAIQYDRADAWLFSGFSEWLLVAALLHGGDAALAQQTMQEFSDLIGDNPRYQIPYRRGMALLAENENDLEQAKSHLEAALAFAQDCGLVGEQWLLLAALADLAERGGNEKTAGSLRSQSREIINQIAKSINDDDLRGRFVAGTAVYLS